MRPTSATGLARPSVLKSFGSSGLSRPSRHEPVGPPNKMNMGNSQIGRPSEFPRHTVSFDGYQSSEHHKSNSKRSGRPTMHDQRQTLKNRNNNEFARCSVISKSDETTSSDEEKGNISLDPNNKRKFPELFRGSGQNG